MLFKKEICFKDEELDFLKAKTSILETSSIKWKKRLDFLGLDLDLVVSGTPDKLNNAQRRIIVNALKKERLRTLYFENRCSVKRPFKRTERRKKPWS